MSDNNGASATTTQTAGATETKPNETTTTEAKPNADQTKAADGQQTPPAKTETKTAESKVADGTKATETNAAEKPVVPEKYELKIPEGSKLEQAQVDEVASYAKELGLSNEQAQKLLDRESKANESYAQKQIERVEAQSKQWRSAIEKDKELGGDNLKKNTEIAHRALKKFASDDVMKFLDSSGLGNHPGVFRMFHKIGSAMSNDKFISTGPMTGGAKKSHSEMLYGSNQKQEQ